MSFIAESHTKSPVVKVGGKGAYLQKLVSWNAPVPPFFIITTETFNYFQREGKIPKVVEERFEAFFEKYPLIALRSSMISEDSMDSSFAGLFETLLDVTVENYLESLQRIFESTKSPRVKEYIQKKELTVSLEMAVVAQRLIKVDKSGVLFTRSPVGATGAIAIDAAYGMGEGVVSGLSDVDHYQYTRTKELLFSNLYEKKRVLEEKETIDLIDLSLKLEKKMNAPSDLEWGIKDNELFVFQIRPITRDFPALSYFVDTNLSESYPGVVSPFTASFVKCAYENVFTESAQIMGATGKQLENLCFHYSNLISCVDNHLYYNLEHYYAAIRALPGGEKNIDNWHKMIGGRISGPEIPYHDTRLSKLESFLSIYSLMKIAWNRTEIFNLFLSKLEPLREEIEEKLNACKNSKDVILHIDALVKRPLGFGLTVVNDIFIMIGVGFLSNRLKKRGFQEEQIIDILKTADGVDSTKPLEHFNLLVQNLSDEFIVAFSKENLAIGVDPYSGILKNLKDAGYKRESELISNFLKEYGDRSFEELKLESLPMKNNPHLLKQLIHWAKKNDYSLKDQLIVNKEIKFNWLERKVIKFTRESISMREATRLWRGKFYHLLRHSVLTLYEKLNLEDTSWKKFEVLDFFSINHFEWSQFEKGKISLESIQSLMLARNKWQTCKKNFPEIIPWVETDTLPELKNNQESYELSGQGVSPGLAEGVALVLDNPNQALDSDLKNFILVTKNTDPAWVYIMSRSLALLSEKGSLLSHTAIIGRELNIPTIVGVKMATQMIKSGDRIRIDAYKGTIEIL